MQPLGTIELYAAIVAAVLLLLSILYALRPAAPIKSTTAYFRRQRSKASWSSLIMQGAVAGWAMSRLAGHFGVLPGPASDAMAMAALGLLIAAAGIEIMLWARGRWSRAGRGQGSGR